MTQGVPAFRVLCACKLDIDKRALPRPPPPGARMQRPYPNKHREGSVSQVLLNCRCSAAITQFLELGEEDLNAEARKSKETDSAQSLLDKIIAYESSGESLAAARQQKPLSSALEQDLERVREAYWLGPILSACVSKPSLDGKKSLSPQWSTPLCKALEKYPNDARNVERLKQQHCNKYSSEDEEMAKQELAQRKLYDSAQKQFERNHKSIETEQRGEETKAAQQARRAVRNADKKGVDAAATPQLRGRDPESSPLMQNAGDKNVAAASKLGATASTKK